MSNISGQGVPNKKTPGIVGDIYTDEISGNKFKLVFIYEIENNKGVITEYDWDPVVEGGATGGGCDCDNQVVSIPIVNGKINLTTDRHQSVKLQSNAEIILPNVSGFEEIHLFVSMEGDHTLTLPNVKSQNEMKFVAGNLYEIIFTHTTEWLFGSIEYSAK